MRDATADGVGAPKQRCARARRFPAVSASRTAVDEARCASTATVRMPSTLNVLACVRSTPRLPARAWPNRKSSPTSTQRDIETPHQHVVDEDFRRHCSEARDRSARRWSVQRRTPETLRISDVAGTGAAGAAPFAKNSRGCGIERQHRRRQAQVLRGLDEPRQHRLMAAMDTVEIADRQCDRTIRLCRKSTIYPHCFGPRAEPLRKQRPMHGGRMRQKLEFYRISRGSSRRPAMVAQSSNAHSRQPPSTSGKYSASRIDADRVPARCARSVRAAARYRSTSRSRNARVSPPSCASS